MKVITNVKDNVIVFISNVAQIVPNGILMDDCILGGDSSQFIIHDIENMPAEICAQEYCYDGTTFAKNSAYLPPITVEDKIRTLEAENQQLKADSLAAMEAIAEVYETLITM